MANIYELAQSGPHAVLSEEAQGFPASIYYPANLASFTLAGTIFFASSSELKVDAKTLAPTTVTRPRCGISLGNFPENVAPAQGDKIQLRGVMFDVQEVKPDGQGDARLVLNRRAS